ncbi:MAG: hypothetical protein AB1567_07605 [bacterium]
MRRLILFFNLLIIPSINLSAQEKVILEHADHAEYLKIAGEEVITLWGDVKLSSGKMCLEADWVQLNMAQDELLAKGKVILVNEQGRRIESKEAKYNLRTKQGRMKAPYISVKPYYCRGVEACFESGTITFYDALLTTCDLPNPHYSLTTAKIIVYPNDKITAKNIFFKVGNIPLFYIPYYSKSLKQRKSQMVIKSGRSNIKGNSLGVTYNYLFTPKSIGSVHLNFLEAQGLGKGVEHKYWEDGTSHGQSYFYYIHENKKRDDVKDTKRWEITAKHLQRFKDITGILHLQLLSDKNVTRDYLREERSNAATWELKNYLAVTKTYSNHTLRLGGERIDLWNDEVEDFKKEFVLLPKLTLQTKSVRKNNIYSNLKVEVANQIDSATNTHYLKGDVGVNLLKKANFLSDKVVFSPKIGLLGLLKEKEKTTGWLNMSLNLRNRIGRYLEINLNHNLKKAFTTDEYHGVETNALVPTLYMWMSKKIRGEIAGGVNLREHKPLKITKARLLPLVADLNLALSDNFVTSLKTTYNFKSSTIDRVETYLDLKKDTWQYGGSGLYYRPHSNNNKDILEVSNYLTFKISPKTQMQVHVYYDLKNHRIKENGLIIEKDLHCWNSKLSIRHGKDTEFWLSLNVK